MMLKHKTAAGLAAAAMITTSLAFTASAEGKDVQADTSKDGVNSDGSIMFSVVAAD